MIKTVAITIHDYHTDNRNEERTVLVANDKDDLFTKFFQMKQRYLYCNSVKVSLSDPNLESSYKDWIKVESNYYSAGGDGW